jgi:WD40 repeat protein
VAFSPPDGQDLVTGNAKGLVQVWDARDGREIRTLGAQKGPVREVVFSRDRDRQYLASVSADGTVNVWDATRLGEKPEPQKPPELLRTLPVHFPGPCSNLVAFSPDGKRLAIGDKEYTVKIWDVGTGQELATLRGHSGDVCAVAFSPDREGRWIASAGEDSTVKIWDSHTGALVHTFRGHRGIVSCMVFMPDGKSLVSGSRDHTVKFWDMTQLEDAPDR